MTKETILIFGGNGFIGGEAAEYLLDNYSDKYELVLVNRDSWDDWDAKERIKSRIKENLYCDREKNNLGDVLKGYLNKPDFKFYAIIDFSAYKAHAIKQVIEHIPAKKINLYIHISTDSVYEVSDITVSDPNYKLKETDAVRPTSESEIKRLKKFDSYGHNKLRCEETLLENAKTSNKFDYIMLRLPDVIGPRDSIERFWYYQMWLQYIDYLDSIGKSNFLLPVESKFFNLKTSYVYVKDVARLIGFLLHSEIRNEIFNTATDEPLTVVGFIKKIAFAINPDLEKKLVFVNEENYENVPHGCLEYHYPSVTKAPIDTSKITSAVKNRFTFTSMDDSIRESVEFYNMAYKKFPRERKRIEKYIRKELLKDKNDPDFESFIEQQLK